MLAAAFAAVVKAAPLPHPSIDLSSTFDSDALQTRGEFTHLVQGVANLGDAFDGESTKPNGASSTGATGPSSSIGVGMGPTDLSTEIGAGIGPTDPSTDTGAGISSPAVRRGELTHFLQGVANLGHAFNGESTNPNGASSTEVAGLNSGTDPSTVGAGTSSGM